MSRVPDFPSPVDRSRSRTRVLLFLHLSESPGPSPHSRLPAAIAFLSFPHCRSLGVVLASCPWPSPPVPSCPRSALGPLSRLLPRCPDPAGFSSPAFTPSPRAPPQPCSQVCAASAWSSPVVLPARRGQRSAVVVTVSSSWLFLLVFRLVPCGFLLRAQPASVPPWARTLPPAL